MKLFNVNYSNLILYKQFESMKEDAIPKITRNKQREEKVGKSSRASYDKRNLKHRHKYVKT